ncbi:SHE3 [Candida oxycetoniae]|uniref:SWI5-dependent HO expression protein 3 n=1 Tax=Candida oxycetoniae TaxID=497107 RepID=A0AAI9SYG6_9ASCO|nr:SHE3 [Candida oxycetoniae]KAI3404974.2 SHE3 [Candida oxycetoniae]
MTSTPETSPSKGKSSGSSSRVIDSLQKSIDELSLEIARLKTTNQELGKKNQIINGKNESYLDQLANLKHENDMLSALLKRKERRILDLEDQNSEMLNSIENLNLSTKQMKIKFETLNDTNLQSIAEHERLKISYEALVASCQEYKQHYRLELDALQREFDNYKAENYRQWEELQKKTESNDMDIDVLLNSMNNKKKSMDNIYITKNTKILTMLTTLANLVKTHGLESKDILSCNNQVIESLLEKYPDLQEKIKEKEKIEIDIAAILADSHDTLNNISFDDEDTILIASPELAANGSSNINSPHNHQQQFSHHNRKKLSIPHNLRKKNNSFNNNNNNTNKQNSFSNSPSQLSSLWNQGNNSTSLHQQRNPSGQKKQPTVNHNIVNIPPRPNSIGNRSGNSGGGGGGGNSGGNSGSGNGGSGYRRRSGQFHKKVVSQA